MQKLTFFETYIKIKSISVENNAQSDIFAFFAFFIHFDKLIWRPPGPLWGGGLIPFSVKISKVVLDIAP